ncbi:PspC domain-containing protein [Agromyces sp. G08B096]|uniref:PspC domain-containing protein n=1 Tax=Agromyces sp. G08B096 TaxID=3156399 RepID=A0AAU7W5I1_9MICO
MASIPTPPAPEAPPPPPPPAAPGAAPGTGFFDWLRSLGVPRRPGWIGGVAAGVAARLGIDPVIVRGILVVLALFGAPAFLAYGVAWLLLPDERGRIHLEQTIRGVFDNAIVGIGIFLVIGLFAPAVGLPWWLDGWGWGWGVDGDGAFDVLRVLWMLLVLGGVVTGIFWLVTWLSRRGAPGAAASPGAPAPGDAASGSAAPGAAPGASATTASAASDAATAAASTGPAPVEPAPPAPSSSTADYETWKAQHEAWRLELDAWRRAQAEANRRARAQIHAEHRARAAAYQAEAEEARLLRRATRPRTSFAYVVATFGAAMLAGAVASFLALTAEGQSPWALPIGLAAAALVTALSMVLAGVLRRRSGFLAFVTVVLLVAALGAATGPRSELAWASSGGDVRSATLIQPVGEVSLTLDESVAERAGTPEMTVLQGAGSVQVEVRDGTRLSLDIACGSCWVELARDIGRGPQTFEGAQLTAARDGVSTLHREIGPGLETGVADAHLAIRAGATRIVVVEVDGPTTEER